jgi:hypothetical protein
MPADFTALDHVVLVCIRLHLARSPNNCIRRQRCIEETRHREEQQNNAIPSAKLHATYPPTGLPRVALCSRHKAMLLFSFLAEKCTQHWYGLHASIPFDCLLDYND